MKKVLSILFCLTSITGLWAQLDPIYVMYTKDCMRTLFYQKTGNGIDPDYNDYQLQINDSTMVVFTVSRTDGMQQPLEKIPAATFGCDNLNITDALVESVNKYERSAFLLENGPVGLVQSTIGSIAIYKNTETRFVYKTAAFNLVYNYKKSYGINENLSKKGKIGMLFNGVNTLDCKEIVAATESMNEAGEPSYTYNFAPQIGLYNKYNGASEYKLTTISGLGTLSEALTTLCNANTSIFQQRITPTSNDMRPSTIVSGTKQPVPNATTTTTTTATPIPATSTPLDYYTVRSNDTPEKIALENKVDINDLLAWNSLKRTDIINIGQRLRITPPPGMTATPKVPTTSRPQSTPMLAAGERLYKVESGDVLTKIAKKHGVVAEDIASLNGFSVNANLAIGQLLRIPASKIGNTYVQTSSSPTTSSVPTTSIPNPIPSSQTTEILAVAAGGPSVYEVGDKESIYDVADKTGVSVSDLIVWNDLNSLQLQQGQKLYTSNPVMVSAPTTITTPVAATEVKEPASGFHTVKMGETLSGIAKKYGTTSTNLVTWNNLTDTGLNIGQELRVAAPEAPSQKVPARQPRTYIIKQGEGIENIKMSTGVAENDILAWNDVRDMAQLAPGRTIYVEDPSLFAATSSLPSTPTVPSTPTNPTSPSIPSTNDVVYIVQRGDGLYGIAKKNSITVDELKTLNKMTNNSVYVGQALIVKKGTEATTPAAPDKKTFESEKLPSPFKETPTTKPTTPTKPTTSATTSTKTKTKTYEVKKGDTMSAIAKKYKMTVDELKKLNKLKSAELQLGQKLTVK